MGELPEHLKGKTFADRPQDTRLGGRPPGSKNRSTIVREILEAKHDSGLTNAERMTVEIAQKALSGDLNAYKELMDSGYGKNVEVTQLQGDPDNPLNVNHTHAIDDKDRDIINRYIEQKRKPPNDEQIPKDE